jgi:very-short-patch-repair endonuclease
VPSAGPAGWACDRRHVPAQRRDSLVLPVPLDVLRPIAGQRRADLAGRRKLDVLRARLAARQDGVVGRAQLIAIGYTGDEIDYDIACARLIRIHRGTYAVGHTAISDRGRIVAALIAAGPGAAVSHGTAAYVYTLIPSMPPFVHVTFTDRVPRKRRGIQVHQANRLDTTIHHGLPITTPTQTIAQLAPRDAARARDEALLLGLIDRTDDDHAEPTRSALERALLPALDAAGLPRPRVNGRVLGHEVDFHWPEHRVIVETDGWRVHGRRRAFESDRARDAQLHAAGWIVLRFTWRQVIRETLLVTVRIAQVLALCESAQRVTTATGALDR